jgi:hypothetical protein
LFWLLPLFHILRNLLSLRGCFFDFGDAFLMQPSYIFPQFLAIKVGTSAVAIDAFGLVDIASDEFFKEVDVASEEVVGRP